MRFIRSDYLYADQLGSVASESDGSALVVHTLPPPSDNSSVARDCCAPRSRPPSHTTNCCKPHPAGYLVPCSCVQSLASLPRQIKAAQRCPPTCIPRIPSRTARLLKMTELAVFAANTPVLLSTCNLRAHDGHVSSTRCCSILLRVEHVLRNVHVTCACPVRCAASLALPWNCRTSAVHRAVHALNALSAVKVPRALSPIPTSQLFDRAYPSTSPPILPLAHQSFKRTAPSTALSFLRPRYVDRRHCRYGLPPSVGNLAATEGEKRCCRHGITTTASGPEAGAQPRRGHGHQPHR